jgi:cytochrome d ubiquinol oxidase subunit I
MSDPVLWHRLQFAFTIVYHYLFPQLTMGLALLIVVLKGWRCARDALERRRALLDRIFGINFASAW